MYSLFLKIVDTLFPPRASEMYVRRLAPISIHQLYTHQITHTIHTVSSYAHPIVRTLIHEAKFYGNERACVFLNILFSRFLIEYAKDIDTIIPIPLSTLRMRTRGYNQVQKILCAGSIPNNIVLETTILIRTRNTRPQTELTRHERLKNMHDAFNVIRKEKIVGKHILLVDDVTTTGATLNTAQAVLLQHHPASVTLLALAH